MRQGYLQRLDQGAFRNGDKSESKEQSEQNRLIWACECQYYHRHFTLSILRQNDRHFYGRSTNLSAPWAIILVPWTIFECEFHSQRLPKSPTSFGQRQRRLRLSFTGFHGIDPNPPQCACCSLDRTMAMVLEGNYARYLDDFRTSATTWHSAWNSIAVSTKTKTTLMIMYEYICLYTNAFSFQAVLTRNSMPHGTSKEQFNKRLSTNIFSQGIMLSPDGRYIFDAIGAAMNLLGLMNSLDPCQVIRYLPSRYYL